MNATLSSAGLATGIKSALRQCAACHRLGCTQHMCLVTGCPACWPLGEPQESYWPLVVCSLMCVLQHSCVCIMCVLQRISTLTWLDTVCFTVGSCLPRLHVSGNKEVLEGRFALLCD